MISDGIDTKKEEKKTKSPGNRKHRRGLAAIAKRISSRPGTGYNKRSAAKAKNPKTGWQRRFIIEMQDNPQVIDAASAGIFDKYLGTK